MSEKLTINGIEVKEEDLILIKNYQGKEFFGFKPEFIESIKE